MHTSVSSSRSNANSAHRNSKSNKTPQGEIKNSKGVDEHKVTDEKKVPSYLQSTALSRGRARGKLETASKPSVSRSLFTSSQSPAGAGVKEPKKSPIIINANADHKSRRPSIHTGESSASSSPLSSTRSSRSSSPFYSSGEEAAHDLGNYQGRVNTGQWSVLSSAASSTRSSRLPSRSPSLSPVNISRAPSPILDLDRASAMSPVHPSHSPPRSPSLSPINLSRPSSPRAQQERKRIAEELLSEFGKILENKLTITDDDPLEVQLNALSKKELICLVQKSYFGIKIQPDAYLKIEDRDEVWLVKKLHTIILSARSDVSSHLFLSDQSYSRKLRESGSFSDSGDFTVSFESCELPPAILAQIKQKVRTRSIELSLSAAVSPACGVNSLAPSPLNANLSCPPAGEETLLEDTHPLRKYLENDLLAIKKLENECHLLSAEFNSLLENDAKKGKPLSIQIPEIKSEPIGHIEPVIQQNSKNSQVQNQEENVDLAPAVTSEFESNEFEPGSASYVEPIIQRNLESQNQGEPVDGVPVAPVEGDAQILERNYKLKPIPVNSLLSSNAPANAIEVSVENLNAQRKQEMPLLFNILEDYQSIQIKDIKKNRRRNEANINQEPHKEKALAYLIQFKIAVKEGDTIEKQETSLTQFYKVIQNKDKDKVNSFLSIAKDESFHSLKVYEDLQRKNLKKTRSQDEANIAQEPNKVEALAYLVKFKIARKEGNKENQQIYLDKLFKVIENKEHFISFLSIAKNSSWWIRETLPKTLTSVVSNLNPDELNKFSSTINQGDEVSKKKTTLFLKKYLPTVNLAMTSHMPGNKPASGYIWNQPPQNTLAYQRLKDKQAEEERQKRAHAKK